MSLRFLFYFIFIVFYSNFVSLLRITLKKQCANQKKSVLDMLGYKRNYWYKEIKNLTLKSNLNLTLTIH